MHITQVDQTVSRVEYSKSTHHLLGSRQTSASSTSCPQATAPPCGQLLVNTSCLDITVFRDPGHVRDLGGYKKSLVVFKDGSVFKGMYKTFFQTYF